MMSHEKATGQTAEGVFLFDHPQGCGVTIECICDACNELRPAGTLPEYMPDVERWGVMLTLGRHVGATGKLVSPAVYLYPHPSGDHGVSVECICDQCSAARKVMGRRATYWKADG